MNRIIYLVFFAIMAVYGGGQYFFSLSGSDETKSAALIEKVVDGDTIYIEKNGQTEKIRLIGIDTPETSDPRKEVECFGREAKEFLQQYENSEVTLESDPTQDNTDKYGRSLRYVWLDDINLNKLMIESGYAYEYTYDKPYKYQLEFQLAEEIARMNQVGLWDPQTCNGER